MLKEIAHLLFRSTASMVTSLSKPGKHIMSAEDADKKFTDYTSKFINLEGLRIHYKDEGEVGQPTMLLLHGFTASLHVWDKWTKSLKGKYRVIRFDIPGFGLSDCPRIQEGELPLDVYMRIIDKFLDALNVKDAHLVGNSMGGWLSWEFAALNPARVNKLVLMNSAGYFSLDTDSPSVNMAKSQMMRSMLVTGAPKFLIRFIVRQCYGTKRKASREFIHEKYQLVNREGNLQALIDLTSHEIKSNTERIPQIPHECLILWGGKDRVIKVADAHRFKEEIPRSELIIYPKAGHIPMLEIPSESVRDTMAFLA